MRKTGNRDQIMAYYLSEGFGFTSFYLNYIINILIKKAHSFQCNFALVKQFQGCLMALSNISKNETNKLTCVNFLGLINIFKYSKGDFMLG